MTDDLIHLRLTLDVSYVPKGTSVEALKGKLRHLVHVAAGDGLLSGDLPAYVDTFSFNVEQVSEHGETIDFDPAIANVAETATITAPPTHSEHIRKVLESLELDMEVTAILHGGGCISGLVSETDHPADVLVLVEAFEYDDTERGYYETAVHADNITAIRITRYTKRKE